MPGFDPGLNTVGLVVDEVLVRQAFFSESLSYFPLYVIEPLHHSIFVLILLSEGQVGGGSEPSEEAPLFGICGNTGQRNIVIS